MTSNKFLRLLIKEILSEAAVEDVPNRYTPQGIMSWKSGKLWSTVTPGSELEKPSFFLKDHPIINFYPADSESETILQFNATDPNDITSIMMLGCKPLPASYVTNTSSKFMMTLKNKFQSDVALYRFSEIAKNVKDRVSLEESRPYNHSQMFFVITSSNNPNFRTVGGEVKNIVGDSLTTLFTELIADPLKGYGIWITKMPKTVQDDTITTLQAMQSALGILSLVPGFSKVAAAANIGPSLALASYYGAIHKDIDPNVKLKIPVVDAEVSAKSLNVFNIGANVFAAIISCYAGVQQILSEISTIQRLNTLSGFSRFSQGSTIDPLSISALQRAYIGLGSNFRLVENFVDSVGTTITSSSSGWQSVKGGFVYVTGKGNSWVNNVTRTGIIADVSGEVIVFTKQEVSLINSIIAGKNYVTIGRQLDAAISGTSKVMYLISIGVDVVGAIFDAIMISDVVKSEPEKDIVSSPDEDDIRQESIPTFFTELVTRTKTDIANGKWSSIYPDQERIVNIIDIDTKKIKAIPYISISSKIVRNPDIGKDSYIPKVILVSSDIYNSFEIIFKIPGSFLPPRNLFWKATDNGSVFIIVSNDYAESVMKLR